MALRRNVGLKGLRYNGGGPMLAWSLHRIGGLAMVLFVGMHILASFFMQQYASDWATNLNIVYESIYFQFLIIFVVYFHGLNGLRIILLDIKPQYLKFQREITWLQWLVFIPLYAITALLMVMFKLSGA